MEKQSELDALIMQHGQEFNNNINKIIEGDKFGNLAYEDNGVLPGMSINMPTSDDVALNKEDAHDNIVTQIAMNKLEAENKAFQKLSDDEKIKNYVCDVQFYHETNEFFKKYGYEMSGKQKRFTKRAIEQAWKKGKLKVTPEQREDILYELSKASNQKVPTQANDVQQNNNSNISEHIKDLNSLIFRQ